MTEFIELELDSIAHGGDAVGRADGKVYFVAGGAPGDRVQVRVTKERASFCNAEIVQLLEPGPGRREPPCELFGRCGGCQLLHLEYEHQLREKEAVLARALRGKVERVLPMVPSPKELGYRRRARMHWMVPPANGPAVLGYLEHRSHRLVDVEACPLLEAPLQRGLQHLRRHLQKLGRSRGTMSALVGAGGEVHLSLRCKAGHPGWRRHLEGLQDAEPVVGVTAHLGRGRLTVGSDRVALLPSLEASAAAFAQANPAVDDLLRRRVRAWAAPAGARVLELYAGVGNLTSALAPKAAEVVAVESEPAGARLLRANGPALGPVKVLQEPAEAAVERLATAGERFDVVVLDPPREGCRGVAPALARLGAQRLIYVSCDPMILARDLDELRAAGFVAEDVEPLDMMPQTFHTESVARLTRSAQ